MKEKDSSKKIVTIPNVLSLFRLILAVVFLVIYLNAKDQKGYYIAFGILVLSAVTDVVDGKIARHFHMVSDLGKILDPFADKLTQGFVMLALVSRYPAMVIEVGIFVMKEAYMSFMGLKVISTTGENNGALWFGKLNTVILYGTSMILILFYDIPVVLANIMIGVCCASILFCFYKYRREFLRILAEHAKNKNE